MGQLSKERMLDIVKLANDQEHWLKENVKRMEAAANAPAVPGRGGGKGGSSAAQAATAHDALNKFLQAKTETTAAPGLLKRMARSVGAHAESIPALATLGLIGTVGAVAAKKISDRLSPKPSVLKHMFSGHGPVVTALGYGVGAGALGAGVWGAKKAYDAVNEPIQKDRGMKAMLEVAPALKHEDKTHVSRVYNTLYGFNKDMAEDPLVASSFVRRSLQFKEEGIQPNDVKTLTEIRKHLSESGKDSKFPTSAADLVGFNNKGGDKD